MKNETAEKISSAARLVTTIDAPGGISHTYEANIPAVKQTAETATDDITTPLKLRKRRIEVTDGNIIRAEMSIAPISFMPTTMVSAASSATSTLYAPARTPEARAKLSSKVTQKIRL